MNVRYAYKEMEKIDNLCSKLKELDYDEDNDFMIDVIAKLSDYRFFLQRAIERTELDI